MDLNAKKSNLPSGTQSSPSSLPSELLDLIARVRQVSNDHILRQPSLRSKTGRANATTWKDVKEGTFPPPIRIGPRAVGWRESEVNAWLEACSISTRAKLTFDMKVFVAQLIAPTTERDHSHASGAHQ